VGIIEDILSALERIPIWKRLQALPSEVDYLKARIAELEDKLGAKWPAYVCGYCGWAHTAFPSVSKGNLRETWRCERCGRQDERIYRPSAR
jgi:hypothetical protein